MLRPLVKNMSRPKNALKVAIVTTIEMIRKPWMRRGVDQAEADAGPGRTGGNPEIQFPPPEGRGGCVAAIYCTTDDITAKEMSMPPAIRTTRRPTAQIRLTELLLRSEVRLPSVRKRVGAQRQRDADCGQRDEKPELDLAVPDIITHGSRPPILRSLWTRGSKDFTMRP